MSDTPLTSYQIRQQVEQAKSHEMTWLHNTAVTLFHRLWGKSQDGAYDKDAWVALQLTLHKLGVKV